MMIVNYRVTAVGVIDSKKTFALHMYQQAVEPQTGARVGFQATEYCANPLLAVAGGRLHLAAYPQRRLGAIVVPVVSTGL
jgi:hypothetical protein